jgi:hypothetical protein
MDFFGQQDAARRNTRRLVLLFALAVVATVVGDLPRRRRRLFTTRWQRGARAGPLFWPWKRRSSAGWRGSPAP